MYLVTADEMRKMDLTTIEEFGLPGRLLMENAGRGATRMFMETFPDAKETQIGIIAGRGNNGGDGFVIARYLKGYGFQTTVFLLTDSSKVQGDAAANLNLLPALDIPVLEIPDEQTFAQKRNLLDQQGVWVDAILGTGLRSEVRGYYRHVIEYVNRTRLPVFAVDIPSGLDSDTGQPHGVSIRADATATFGFAKTGHVQYPGKVLTGKLGIVDIGIPGTVIKQIAPRQWLLTSEAVCRLLLSREPDAHKGDAGHLMVVAGSPGKTGAAALTSLAAMRAGAGLVTLGAPKGLNPVLESQVLEVMTLPLDETEDGRLDFKSTAHILATLQNKKCLAIGPGLGVSPATQKLLFEVLKASPVPVVLDADAITLLAEDKNILKSLDVPVILTPHPGEMARLNRMTAREIQEDRLAVARDFATTYNVHLVLKGAGTVTAHPDGSAFINSTGNPGMASGGMGDVLTGIIAGLITQGHTPKAATQLGVWIHGAAADALSHARGAIGFLASDILAEIPSQLALLHERRPGRGHRDPFLQGVM